MTQNLFIRPTQLGQTPSAPVKKPQQHDAGQNFAGVFQHQLLTQSEVEVKFSAHALKRMESRNIKLSGEDLSVLNEAVDRAEAKGARESLILMDQLALIVSVKNRTVITAVDGESLRENVFTNIDSAIIAK